MSRSELIDKLEGFLGVHVPLSEECHVVYVMVEIRKILDHERSVDAEQTKKHRLLRFYCDWAVHTEKSRITEEIRVIVADIFEAAKDHIENGWMREGSSRLMNFAHMKDLQSEMQSFLSDRGISSALVQGDQWVHFVELLVKVLENQPILNPTDTVESFAFLPVAEGSVRGLIKFAHPINGWPAYQFLNAY